MIYLFNFFPLIHVFIYCHLYCFENIIFKIYNNDSKHMLQYIYIYKDKYTLVKKFCWNFAKISLKMHFSAKILKNPLQKRITGQVL